MIQNMNQLKKTLKQGTRFRILEHSCSECIGEVREVTYANTQCCYSIVPDNPNARASLANNGRGSTLWWSKASCWDFEEGKCSQYLDDKNREEKYHVVTLQVMEQEAA